MKFSSYRAKNGDELLYVGTPDVNRLDQLAEGPGDLWHSSLDQGFKNAFKEVVYQTAVFFMFSNDFDSQEQSVSWRINPDAFIVRSSVWEQTQGFDQDYANKKTSALDFGFNFLRYHGMTPLYVKGLFAEQPNIPEFKIAIQDRYMFFRKNFKIDHSIYMLWRKGFWRLSELSAYFRSRVVQRNNKREDILPRKLRPLMGSPRVSYIIPTMFRQQYTRQLLEDLENQTFEPYEVIIIDATPESERRDNIYLARDFSFQLTVKWQTSKGSCRARNEAISLSTGDYVVFGDDDIRIPPEFIENHIRLLQTYGAEACNGLDIRADHPQQGLQDLMHKLDTLGQKRWKVGAAQCFSNANSCVSRKIIQELGGNDVNFDGGYGEDSDFGFSIFKFGYVVLHNPFSANLHLKPPSGGYRFWGAQARLLGKKRKSQPWELEHPVKWIQPVPSPTVMYGLLKNNTSEQRKEYKIKYFINYFKGVSWYLLPLRIMNLPYKMAQYRRSVFYATHLMNRGKQLK